MVAIQTANKEDLQVACEREERERKNAGRNAEREVRAIRPCTRKHLTVEADEVD